MANLLFNKDDHSNDIVDYDSLAKTTFSAAVEYYKVFRLLFNPIIIENKAEFLILPACTNGAFACELFLKSILYMQEQLTSIKGHKLDSLFYQLLPAYKDKIITSFQKYDYDETEFIRHLKYSSDAFTVIRYRHERKTTAVSDVFLGLLSTELLNLCKEIFRY